MNSEIEHPRETTGGVFAIALGLLLIGISALTLFAVRMSQVDGAVLLDERFASHRMPAGLQVVNALRLGDGKEVVVLSDPTVWEQRRVDESAIWTPIEAKQAKKSKPDFGGGFGGGPGGGGGPRGDGHGGGGGRGERGGGMPASGGGFPTTDWKSVEEGEPGQAPWELAFVWYPREMGEKVLRSQFGGRGFGDLRFVGSDGGKVTTDQGPVAWGAYDTHFVIERQFGKVDDEKIFRDTLRINLSLGQRACVLYARWAQGAPASIETVSALLAGFTPIPVE